MADLTTRYMGLTLNSPLVVGSCGLTSSVDNIVKLEANGAAAVVLKSLFEEQILMESASYQADISPHTEEMDYIKGYVRQNSIDDYLQLIRDTKKQVSLPVIASINCLSASEWTTFAGRIEKAGADGLELNVFIMPGDPQVRSEEIEKVYFDIVKAVKEQVSIPIGIKIGSHFTGMANMIRHLSQTGVDNLVLFNRFYQPDIDLDRIEVVSAPIFSTPEENTLSLRWIGMLSGKVECDLVSSTGIHDGSTVIKNLLAGAGTVQIVSALYQKGPEVIGQMLTFIRQWMDERGFASIRDFAGKLSYDQARNPVLYERAQFMKYFSSAPSSGQPSPM